MSKITKKLIAIATLIWLGTQLLYAPPQLIIRAQIENGRRVLYFDGGSIQPPYKVQRKTPTTWVDITPHIYTNRWILSKDEPNNAIYRVRTVPAPTRSVNLAWGASPDPNNILRGYLIYYGVQSMNYTNIIRVQTTSATVTGLAPNTVYYFAVAAYDISGLTSDLSEELIYRTLP